MKDKTTVVRSKLIQLLASKSPHLSSDDVESCVSIILRDIAQSLVDGRRTEIRGFGVFSLRSRNPRIGRNPLTGEAVHIGNRSYVHFKPGSELRLRIEPTLRKN